MNSDFKPLHDYLTNVYRQFHIEDAADGVEVVAAYRNIVGDLISKLTQNAKYENHCLYLSIASAALRTELSYKRQSLVDKINEKLGRQVLKSIVLK